MITEPVRRPARWAAAIALTAVAGLFPVAVTTTSAEAATVAPDACGSRIPKSTGGYWSCSFVDNFDGKSLDTSKWNVQDTRLSGYTLNETCYRGNNVALRSGTAVLSVTKSPTSSTCGGTTTPYTGADINTWGKFSQTNGRFEVRMKFPAYAGAGYQGGFWMNPQNLSYGDASGEIDVAEWFSQYSNFVLPNLHYAGSGPADMGICSLATPAAWHTYGVEWSRTRMDFFIDGTLCHSRTWQPTSPLLNPQPFDKPFFLDLTAGVGGTTNSPTASTPFPAAITVDYARVWK